MKKELNLIRRKTLTRKEEMSGEKRKNDVWRNRTERGGGCGGSILK